MARDLRKEDIKLGQYVSFMNRGEENPRTLYGKVVDLHYDDADGDITVTLDLGDFTVHFPIVEQLIARKAMVYDDLGPLILKVLNDSKPR